MATAMVITTTNFWHVQGPGSMWPRSLACMELASAVRCAEGALRT